ncbi:MAG TPA: LPS assembly protein LptD [Methylomirabilota bacterium]|nr:LPS assembly protein LptD [Methylomirabilota bacterium]
MRTSCRFALSLAAALFGAAWLPGISSAQAPAAPQVPVTVDAAGGDVTILSDRLEEVGPDRLLVATGNVEITRGKSRLIADRVEINRATGDAVAQGRVVFYDGEDQLTGRRIDYNLRTGTGVVYDSEARVAPYYRIAGERLDRLGESIYHVRKGVFTTCEDDPPTWSFHFGDGTADLEDFVYGTNASLWVKDVPLIPFVPFFAAAIRRERQTGFLFPRFGTSGRKGFMAEVPFYWAISDSQDATIAPLVYSRLGEGATLEHRYVLSTDQRGSESGFLLQETHRNGATRGEGSLRHEWYIAPGLVFKADVNGVTDDNVLRQYGDRLQQRSADRVESNVFLTKSWNSWNFVGNLFNYQDLTTPRSVELRRLPDLNLLGTRQPVPGIPGLLYEQESSYVNFVRAVGSSGQRVDLHPRLSRPVPVDGLFTVTPYAGGRLTLYDARVVGFRQLPGVPGNIEITEDTARLRELGEWGVDVETALSRVYAVDGAWGIDALLHSIEPRVGYQWITGRNKTRLPVWTQGLDQIPETGLVTYSLTNRIRARAVPLADSEPLRWELLRFVVGNSYDTRNDRVGSITGTLITQPNERLRFRTDIVHGVHGEGIELLTSDVSIRLLTIPISLSVGSRYSDPGKISFVTTGFGADLSRYFYLRNTNAFDTRTGTFVEARVGGDIRFQCWALTVEFVHREGRASDEVSFAVNLLGVGGPFRTAVGLGALEGSGEK